MPMPRTSRTILRTVCLLVGLAALAAGADAPPALKVGEGGRHLLTAGGQPFFWLGDTAWALCYRLTIEEASRYLEDRRDKRFNVIQAVLIGGSAAEPNAYGERALLPRDPSKPPDAQTNPPDPARPNGAYFAHVDRVVDRAASLGLHMALLPTWGSNVTDSKPLFDATSARVYGEFLGRRYRARPVIWVLGGDQNAPGFEAVWRALADGLIAGGGRGHLMTYHPRGGASSGQWFHDEPWLDFNMIQSGHTRFRPAATDRLLLVARDVRRAPAKPVLDAESVYEDIPEGLTRGGTRNAFDKVPQGERITAHDVRAAAYGTVLSGACGYTYGGNGVFQMAKTNLSASLRWDPRGTWEDALRLPAAAQMQHLRTLMESFPMSGREPAPGLAEAAAAPAARTAYDLPVAARGATGDFALVYSALGGAVRAHMDRLAPPAMDAFWYNPRSGRWHDGGAETADRRPFAHAIPAGPSAPAHTFDPPGEPGPGNDWVLVLKRSADAAHPAPVAGISQGATATLRGVWQADFPTTEAAANPFLDVDLHLVFTQPDGTTVKAEGFFKGGGVWACRAYCSQAGAWTWRSVANRSSLDGRSGTFTVQPSDLPGKLRKHPDDPRQFATDDGAWFLHLGDTGYRFLVDTEPEWKAYVDEAAEAGFTKIRAWTCRSRGGVEAYFTGDRSALDLAFWDEMERRLLYALKRHPRLQIQFILYGEDTAELLRYGSGDRMARLAARYAQARFSAFPNVHWCISNDRFITAKPGPNNVAPEIIDRIGRDLRAREPWGTLLTNHQRRFEGYSFVDAEWSDIVTLEDRDQTAGARILEYRARSKDDPVVLDEDRYGLYISPRHDRFFFRRLMWASLLGGGHATYGGLNTYLPHDGSRTNGVRGYLTAVREGALDDGAADFPRIRRFFGEAGVTLVGLESSDAMAGGNPSEAKVAAGRRAAIAYLPNADGPKPETANVRETRAACQLDLPAGAWRARWYDPRTGRWHEAATVDGDTSRAFEAPFNGDAVLLLTRP